MTTANTSAMTPAPQSRFRLPDPPSREPDEMTQYDQLFKTGASRGLAIHLGNPETTLVEADRSRTISDPSDTWSAIQESRPANLTRRAWKAPVGLTRVSNPL